MTTTQQARNWWAPPCRPDLMRTITLHGGGRITIRASLVDAYLALNRVLERWDYRTRPADTGAYNCRPITGGVGYSLHAYGIAADLNWTTNPYGPVLRTDMPRAMVDEILAITTNNGAHVFRWGGDYRGNKDAMHYEPICSPADIATGIRGASVPAPVPNFPTQPNKERPVHLYQLTNGMVIAVDGLLRMTVAIPDLPIWQARAGGPPQRLTSPADDAYWLRATVPIDAVFSYAVAAAENTKKP